MASNTSVLIVEDEPAIVELVSYSLRETGWKPLWRRLTAMSSAIADSSSTISTRGSFFMDSPYYRMADSIACIEVWRTSVPLTM